MCKRVNFKNDKLKIRKNYDFVGITIIAVSCINNDRHFLQRVQRTRLRHIPGNTENIPINHSYFVSVTEFLFRMA